MQEEKVYEKQELLTIGNLIKVFKQSLGRMIIFCLVAAIAAGVFSAIYIPVSVYNSKSVSTIVDFGFSGIQEGKDPYGAAFDPQSLISPSVVNKATTAILGDSSRANSLIDHMSVTDVIPNSYLQKLDALQKIAEKDPLVHEQINDLKYYPTRFVLKFENYNQQGFSRKDAINLLNKIVEEYKAEFKSKYILAPVNKLIDLDINYLNYDYIERYNIIYNALSLIIEDIQIKMNATPAYISPSQAVNFASFLSKFLILRDTDLKRYESYVTSYGITMDMDYTLTYLQNEYRKLIIYINQTDADANSIFNLIKSYEHTPLVVVGESSFVTNAPSEEYDALFRDLSAKRLRAQSYRAQCEIIALQFDYFTSKIEGEKPALSPAIPATPDYSELNNVTPSSALIEPSVVEIAPITLFDVTASAYSEQDLAEMADTMTDSILSQTADAVDMFKDFIVEYNDVMLYSVAVSQSTRAFESSGTSGYFKTAFIVSAALVAIAFFAAYFVTLSIFAKKLNPEPVKSKQDNSKE